jgi:hypothetical protein
MPEDLIRARRTAMIDDGTTYIQIVSCDPGDKIFDTSGEKEIFLGIVLNGKPVINAKALTAYLSHDDYDAAKAAIPNRKRSR